MALRNFFLSFSTAALVRGSFTAGSVCAGFNASTTTPASNLLRGKTLRVYETPWKPFAIKDATQPSGWTGLDVDLLDMLAADLGFTYEIIEFTKDASLGDTSWTDSLFRVAEEGDLVMSYWTRTQVRMERVVQIAGHIDMSSVLAARRDLKEPTIVERMISFMRPYTLRLWLVIIAMTLCAGLVDYLLERWHHEEGGTEARLGHSIYEYVGGMLFGAFEYPRSRASAIYQIVMAFIMLITIATYTANLAAFVTLSAKPSLSATSVLDSMVNEKRVCSYLDNPQVPTYDILYPSLKINVFAKRNEMLASLTENTGCAAVILPMITYDTFKMSEAGCSLRVVQTVFPGAAGWVTNRASPCLQQAFEWALNGLEARGAIRRLYFKWLPAYNGCGATTSSKSVRRRRLAVTDARADGDDDSTERRLSEDESSKEAGDQSTTNIGIMDLPDFIGIFILFGVATIGSMLFDRLDLFLTKRLESRSAMDALFKLIGRPVQIGPMKKTVADASMEANGGETEDVARRGQDRQELRDLKVSMDDQAGMIRELLMQVLAVKDAQISNGRDQPIESGLDSSNK